MLLSLRQKERCEWEKARQAAAPLSSWVVELWAWEIVLRDTNELAGNERAADKGSAYALLRRR